MKKIVSIFLSVFFAGLSVSLALAEEAGLVKALDVRLAGDEQRTRLVVDLSQPIEFAAFTLADPYRVVIDVPEIDFSALREKSRRGRGLVRAFRYGLITKGKSRLVLDLDKPVLLDQAFILQEVEDQPARLVFDLTSTSRMSFLETVGRLKSVGSLKPPEPPSTAPSPRARGKTVVVLDPGHGGIDDGALGAGGIKEKDIVLDFAKALQESLNALGGFEVYLTREEDSFISLGERVDFARRKRAALMISLHADIVVQDYVRGATIYTLSETASDEMAEALAEKENRSDVIAGVVLTDKSDEVANILIDLARRETKNLSVSFARGLLQKVRPHMRLNKNPLRSGGFLVLKAPDVPSVLVELGYLSNSRDKTLLTLPEWRQKAAQSFALAIQAFFKN